MELPPFSQFDQKERKGRRAHFLQVSLTEREEVFLVVLSRLKRRVQLLGCLLLLEFYKSLRPEFQIIKYYIPEFYTDFEFILIEDLILKTRNTKTGKFSKRIKMLQKFDLLTKLPRTKFEAQSMVSQLEIFIEKRPTKGHSTRYGYTKHYKDKGHLPPDKPDYSKDPEELEEEILSQLQDREKRLRIRVFLLSEGKTKFEELFFSPERKMENT